MNTQLLCTFCTGESLEEILAKIKTTYKISYNVIYVLENTDSPNSYCCTYNVILDAEYFGEIPDFTISLHRKKSTNTLYTINALNLLVKELNNGKMDSSFKIPWENYTNTIFVTAYGKLKKIPTRLNKIVKLDAK
jgi:hypothetical protein